MTHQNNNYSIPVDPAGPDCYLGENKPCELYGIPKIPMANCLVTHDQLTLWRKITSGKYHSGLKNISKDYDTPKLRIMFHS